jgi:transcriptional antiterminator Rof (Rho-off)
VVGVAQAARARISGSTALIPVTCRGHSACAVVLTLDSGKTNFGRATSTTKAKHTKIVHLALNAQGRNRLLGSRRLTALLSVTERTLLVSAQKLHFRGKR